MISYIAQNTIDVLCDAVFDRDRLSRL